MLSRLEIDIEDSFEDLMNFQYEVNDTGQDQNIDYRENDELLLFDNNSSLSNAKSPSSKQNRSIFTEPITDILLQNPSSIFSEPKTGNLLQNHPSIFSETFTENLLLNDDSNFNDTNTELNNMFDKIDFDDWSEQFQISLEIVDDQHERNLSIRRRRSPKRKIDLSEIAFELKYRYYSIFTKSKKFPKKYVLQIHNDYLVKELGYPKSTREQMREIDLYFMANAKNKDQILEFLEQNKEKLLQGPLKNIKKKKLN